MNPLDKVRLNWNAPKAMTLRGNIKFIDDILIDKRIKNQKKKISELKKVRKEFYDELKEFLKGGLR